MFHVKQFDMEGELSFGSSFCVFHVKHSGNFRDSLCNPKRM